ncbi:MAG: ABC transporter ATP-binding protein [Phycisphaerales bacterium]|nr:ABC transporter ATP-binding protein [Phycisphaerales bacterium]
MSSECPAIDLSGLSVTYRTRNAERRALDGISLRADNQLVAMLGPNGAGKSTLMGVLCGMIAPDEGTVTSPTTREQLAIVFQTPALDELLTVRENILLAGAMHGMSKAGSLTRLSELARPLHLDDRLSDQVRHLSGGLKRRADLARALIADPGVLLLDEPTTGLDIEARQQFWSFLGSRRRDRPMTILLATHLTEEAQHADRVLLMREGRIIADDTPANLKHTLGDRILRVQTTDPSAVRDWASASGHEFREGTEMVLIADANQEMLASCPDGRATMTLAVPTLADVYSWHAGVCMELEAAS